MTLRIAFIGLGHMGGPMARRLHAAGHRVRAFDLSAEALAAARADGVSTAASALDAVSDAEVVISMLPASHHVEALYLGGPAGDGLLPHLPTGTLVIDSSTIAAESARRLAETAAARGLDALDAPVSGGTAGAAAGTLTFMVGGSDHAVERARPVLMHMGARVFHAGPSGAGQSAKICNNLLLGITMLGTAEALALGEANGLDPEVLSDIMRQSSGGNWVLEKYNPHPSVMAGVPAARAYAGGFASELMLKDLGLAQASATATGAATPLGSLARSLYAAHRLAGHGALDFSSVMGLFQPHQLAAVTRLAVPSTAEPSPPVAAPDPERS